MGEVELTGPRVIAFDALIAYQRFDVVEGFVDLCIQTPTEIAMGLPELFRPAFNSGMTMPPLRVLAPTPLGSASSRTVSYPSSAK
jgi:hypothetical protein